MSGILYMYLVMQIFSPVFQALCSELENRQFTLDTVNKKVEAVLLDLTPKDREEMENSVKKLSIEHTRVYGVAIERKNVLAEALNAREVFAFGLERVNMWLEDKQTKLADLYPLRLVAAEVEKQIDKAKVILMNSSVLGVSLSNLVTTS